MRRAIVTLALFAMMTAFGASKAHAVLLTYSYTGPTLTFAAAPFTTSDRITGSFTIDCGALGGGGDCSSLPNSNYASAVTSWSFTADGFTLDSSSNPPGSTAIFAQFSTDSNANIIVWQITATTTPLNLIFELDMNVVSGLPANSCGICDIINYRDISSGLFGGGFVEGSVGTWTVSEASIPEPSTLANALLSLAALLFLLWRLRALPARVYGRPLAP